MTAPDDLPGHIAAARAELSVVRSQVQLGILTSSERDESLRRIHEIDLTLLHALWLAAGS